MPLHPSSSSRLRHLLVAAMLGAAWPVGLQAQIGVATMTTGYADQSERTINFDNDPVFERTTVSITQFKDIAGNIYDANTVALNAYVRRNTTAGNANQSSVWYADSNGGSPSGTGDFRATYANSYDTLLLGNNILRGSDNTFANGTTAADGNIERLDFIFNGTTGIVSSISTSFAVFDRGAIGVHDSVKIAVITSLGTVNGFVNAPTSYGGTLVSLTSASYGSANIASDFNYHLFRSDNGDTLNATNDYWTDNTETGTQGIGGAVISMSDLGIAAGTTIYGYSLMAYDVANNGSMANLVDWTNTTYYASDTTNATGTGGIDLSAVNGVLYNKRVPEPSTYGAIFLGLSATFFGWRRYRRSLTAPAA